MLPLFTAEQHNNKVYHMVKEAQQSIQPERALL